MDTLEAPIASEPVTTPIPSEPSPPADSESIADHAEQFGPAKREREPANTGQFAERPSEVKHKAASQRATPEDVAEINRLTKELREAEQRIGDKDPDAAVSPRVRTLKRQIAALKALEAPAQPAKAEPQPAKPSAVAVPGQFTEPEPVLDDFVKDPEKYADPYAAWLRACNTYDRKKEAWEASQRQAQESTEQQIQTTIANHNQRIAAFRAKTPDFDRVTGELMTRTLPPVLLMAIAQDDKGADYVYHLAQHPALVDELFLLTAQAPVTDASVAIVQRRLNQQLQAAKTGSAASATVTYTPPKPPNPVRTGPLRTGDELPGDDASLADHERAYGRKRR